MASNLQRGDPEALDFWTCFFLDSKLHTNVDFDDDFDDNSSSSTGQVSMYKCKAHGMLLFDEFQEPHSICILIASLIFLVSLFGVITNILNLLILGKCFAKETSFKDALLLLAGVELSLCAFVMLFATSTLLILENVERSEWLLELFRVSNLVASFSRTASIYVTILVTVERYLVVAFPLQSRQWLRPAISRPILAGMMLFSLAINLPWMLKSKVTPNLEFYSETETDSSKLESFPFIVRRTQFAKVFNRLVQETLLAVNYVLPFPLLLLFNGLLYKSIWNWNKNRTSLSGKQKKEMNAARMFSLVVLILLISHFVSCVVFFTTRVGKVIHRELLLLQSLCVVFGAAANFIVYYSFGQGFKAEFKALFQRAQQRLQKLYL